MISLKITKNYQSKQNCGRKIFARGGDFFVQEEEEKEYNDGIIIAPWRLLCIKCMQFHSYLAFLINHLLILDKML